MPKRVSAISTAEDVHRKYATEAYNLACNAMHAIQELVDLQLDMRREHPEANFVDTNALRDAESTLAIVLSTASDMRE